MPPRFQVYIVESPSFDDLYREKTEGRLIAQGLALADIPSTLRLAGDARLFRKALDPALSELKDVDTVPPLLHLSTHGNNEGLPGARMSARIAVKVVQNGRTKKTVQSRNEHIEKEIRKWSGSA